mmetsp:Transcript_47951/g.80535  ORF Transcript_47951/g.80535 Transcript_47951/m.80535 type:complete len:147 (-) Transcript_47951:222-662(-)
MAECQNTAAFQELQGSARAWEMVQIKQTFCLTDSLSFQALTRTSGCFTPQTTASFNLHAKNMHLLPDCALHQFPQSCEFSRDSSVTETSNKQVQFREGPHKIQRAMPCAHCTAAAQSFAALYVDCYTSSSLLPTSQSFQYWCAVLP